MLFEQNTQKHTIPKFFNTLDILRGLAALSVIFYHWKHFFFNGIFKKEYNSNDQPLYPLFSIFYDQGELAVDLFFLLSGFIFFWLYAQKISNKIVKFREFSLLRFSRLYPLHLITLITVIVLQLIHLSVTHQYFVYPTNDFYHFVLNIFLISKWGFEIGNSFNGPFWSVSVEIFLYLLFFIVCRVKLTKTYHIFIIFVLGTLLSKLFPASIGRGIFAFFFGALVFRFYAANYINILKYKLRYIVYIMTITLWTITILGFYNYINLIFLVEKYSSIMHVNSALIYKIYIVCILFPISILSLVLLETTKHDLGERFAFIGRLSYSSYLLHFPLQLIFKILVSIFTIKLSILMTPGILILFFIVLIPLSLKTYEHIEMPLQDKLRKAFRIGKFTKR